MRSPQNFIINGKTVKTIALNINDQNYLKIVDFARLMDMDISCKAGNLFSSGGADSITVNFDKTKTFTGVRNADEGIRELALMLTGDEVQQPDKYLADAELINGTVYQTLGFDGCETVLNIDGYNYMELDRLALQSDTEVSYDVATDTVRLDKSKPNHFMVRIVADGAPVCPITRQGADDPVGTIYGSWMSFASPEYFSGTPGVLKNGLIAEAQYRSLPYGDVYQTANYGVSDGFLKDSGGVLWPDIVFGENAVSFSVSFYDSSKNYYKPGTDSDFYRWYSNDYLMPWVDRGPFLNALGKLIAVDVDGSGVKDTSEVRAKLSSLFHVTINNEPINGTLTRQYGNTAQTGLENYVFRFDNHYPIGGIQTVRVELDDSGMEP